MAERELNGLWIRLRKYIAPALVQNNRNDWNICSLRLSVASVTPEETRGAYETIFPYFITFLNIDIIFRVQITLTRLYSLFWSTNILPFGFTFGVGFEQPHTSMIVTAREALIRISITLSTLKRWSPWRCEFLLRSFN